MIHEIPMIIDPTCDRPWSDKLPFEAPDYICATSLNTADFFSPRTCHGDSGSGMEQIDERGRSMLLAMTSFGTKGCPANELARFTRVSHYLRPICAYTGICYSQEE
uniref:Peptidase S1 domain-containing protein n=1 Tax=Angiostrongylus cantonensis TaxID=6313 RepID=A0A0K0DGF1_ANGCA